MNEQNISPHRGNVLSTKYTILVCTETKRKYSNIVEERVTLVNVHRRV